MNPKAYKWKFEVRNKCSFCGEANCETLCSYQTRKILVRDCETFTYERLPKYLLEEMNK